MKTYEPQFEKSGDMPPAEDVLIDGQALSGQFKEGDSVDCKVTTPTDAGKEALLAVLHGDTLASIPDHRHLDDGSFSIVWEQVDELATALAIAGAVVRTTKHCGCEMVIKATPAEDTEDGGKTIDVERWRHDACGNDIGEVLQVIGALTALKSAIVQEMGRRGMDPLGDEAKPPSMFDLPKMRASPPSGSELN